MKILHTSDLHLGAKTEGFSRACEQRSILFEIAKIAYDEKIDVVVIAGDIFHVANPSAEAEDMFYEFLEKLTKNNDRVVLVVAGNHDDPKRLACVAPLAKRHNIVLCTDLAPLPAFGNLGEIRITKTSRGFVEIEKGKETICAALLPYASESRILPSLEGQNIQIHETYEQNVEEWANFVAKNFKKDAFNLFVSHQYIVGAKIPEGKQNRTVSIGETLSVSANIFPDCDYVAVGHLHSCQKIKGTKNTYYSGATIRLRAYDSDPRVLVFDTQNPNPKEIALTSAAKIVELKAKNVEDAVAALEKQDKNSLVYLTLTNVPNISPLEIKEIRKIGPIVLAIKIIKKVSNSENSVDVKNISPSELFVEFVKQKTGDAPSEKLLSMFLEILEENE